MKRIELDIWEPVPEQPRRLRYAGQRTGQEVFAELQHHLESMGYLPDEYFLIGDHWKDGREIPKDAEIFCTADYGGSEGIYLNIGLRWFEEDQQKPTMKSLAIGKTLGETRADMDRMHLIASAVIKAFHTDGEHARYIQLGEPEKAEGAVLHLTGPEQQLLIDSLVARRSMQLDGAQETEHLLRRVTGSVIEFVNEVGARPMRISDFDRAVLAIQDGSHEVLQEALRQIPDKTGELLAIAAGRPGTVGQGMTLSLLPGARDMPQELYLAACKNAIATGDVTRTAALAYHAAECVKDLDMSLYGAIIHEALGEHRHIAEALLKQCTREQLAASNPCLMAEMVSRGDLGMARQLAGSGLDVNPRASDIIRALTWRSDNRYYFKYLVEAGMEIDNSNFAAMHACIDTDNPEAAKLLIDRGMDFDAFTGWAKNHVQLNPGKTLDAVRAHWEGHRQEQALGQGQAEPGRRPGPEQEQGRGLGPGPEQGPELTMGGV